MPQGSKKQISSKIVVVILSVCVTCTTVAFLASVICQVCRRERCSIQSPMISSDKETSYSSTTNLFSHKTSSPVSNITGKPVLCSLFLESVYQFKCYLF